MNINPAFCVIFAILVSACGSADYQGITGIPEGNSSVETTSINFGVAAADLNDVLIASGGTRVVFNQPGDPGSLLAERRVD